MRAPVKRRRIGAAMKRKLVERVDGEAVHAFKLRLCYCDVDSNANNHFHAAHLVSALVVYACSPGIVATTL
jgi:hypothetical protein